MFSRLFKWISDKWIAWLNQERPVEGLPLCDFERIRYELRPCDVLLIEGRSRVSEIIQNITQSSWSHAALYIGRLHDIEDPKIQALVTSHYNGPPEAQLLVESIMGKGAIITDLTDYQYDHIRLCRPKGLSRQDAQRVISYAVQKLGFGYDVRHVMDLARFMLPWTLFPRKFRSKLFEEHAGENTKTVCSTMIAEAFDSVEFPILPLVKKHDVKGIELIIRNPRLYAPRDFDYSPYFEIIKYPFVEFADYAIYRKLPWNREGLVSHDRVGVKTHKDPKKSPPHPYNNHEGNSQDKNNKDGQNDKPAQKNNDKNNDEDSNDRNKKESRKKDPDNTPSMSRDLNVNAVPNAKKDSKTNTKDPNATESRH